MEPKENGGPVATRTAPNNNNDLTDSITLPGSSPEWQRTGGTTGAGYAARRRPLPGMVPSVLAGQDWFRNASPQWRRQVVQAVQEAAARSAVQRVQVAAHADLRQRVCRALGLKHFDQWSGYVPAEPEAPPRPGNPFGVSLIRRELVAIVREAARRAAPADHTPAMVDVTLTMIDSPSPGTTP